MSSDATPPATPNRRTRAQRLAVVGFFVALGLTMLTVLLTAVNTRRSHEPEGSPPAASGAAPEHPRGGEDVPGPR